MSYNIGKKFNELIIEKNGITVERVSELLCCNLQEIVEIISNKSEISPILAVRISKVFGIQWELFLGMQNHNKIMKALEDDSLTLEQLKRYK